MMTKYAVAGRRFRRRVKRSTEMKASSRSTLAILALCFIPLLQGQASAPQAQGSGGGSSLAQQAADPTAPLMAFNLKDDIKASYYGVPGSGHTFVFQPVIPFRVWGISNLLRATVNHAITGPAGRGLESVSVFDLLVFGTHWGRWGVGPLVEFLPREGPGKDTTLAGPAIGAVAVKGKWNLGLFSQNLFGQSVRFSSLQPVIAYTFGGGWSLSAGDAQFGIDWAQSKVTSVPIGVQLAKVTTIGGQPIRFFVNPEYNARNTVGGAHWSVRLALTILSPL